MKRYSIRNRETGRVKKSFDFFTDCAAVYDKLSEEKKSEVYVTDNDCGIAVTMHW